jgi:hypothetical protein
MPLNNQMVPIKLKAGRLTEVEAEARGNRYGT